MLVIQALLLRNWWIRCVLDQQPFFLDVIAQIACSGEWWTWFNSWHSCALFFKYLCHHLNCGVTACRWCTFSTNECSPILSDIQHSTKGYCLIQPNNFTRKVSSYRHTTPCPLCAWVRIVTCYENILTHQESFKSGRHARGCIHFHPCSHVNHAPDSARRMFGGSFGYCILT